MGNLDILIITLISLLAVSYIVSDRDIMAPGFLFIAGFVLATCAALMNVSAWGIDLSAKTIGIIFVGALSFISAEVLYRITHKKNVFKMNIKCNSSEARFK